MPAVEARSRRPRYKEYKRVWDAQNFACRLGVGAADYGDRVDIGNIVNHALYLAHERGVPMPSAVRLRPFTEEDDYPDEIAYYQAGFGDSPGEIVINSYHPVWNNPAEAMRRARDDHSFSTGDAMHPIAHELGELAMHQAVGGDKFNPLGVEYLAAEQAFRREDLGHIYEAVSDRATTNHSEFVAETFAAILLGRDELRQDRDLMQLYERYGGPEIRRFDQDR
jgi:hypothetical protein